MPRTGLSASEIKEKAIDLTMTQMRQGGFDKVRLIDVARALGLSHAALYAHFADKTELLDAVSERWLLQIDASLAAVCRKNLPPVDRIILWMITLHRAKIAKVLHDPELYKAFDLSTAIQKPFAQRHMDTMQEQLTSLAAEAIAKWRLRDTDPTMVARILQESTMAFHHPKLIAQHIQEKREPLLRLVLDSVLRGLKLKS